MVSLKKNWIPRVGIVVIAAILVETISLVQYQRIRNIMGQEMRTRSNMAIGSMREHIEHILEFTEATMRENQLYIKHLMSHPDSMFKAMEYLIDDNPHVVGGCMAFIPDYYPSKGHLFEPYASKNGDTIRLHQLAGPSHDYTQNVLYRQAVETGVADWSDPYYYEGDPFKCIITYSYPIKNGNGQVIAVCGLDLDLSWMVETMNANQRFPSSFGLVLSKEGELVVGPPEEKASPALVNEVCALLRENAETSLDKKLTFRSTRMERNPYWQIVQVYKDEEVFSTMRKFRLQQVFFILLGLAILFFMIERFARNEKKLRDATAEKSRIDGELAVARSIQQKMLPKEFPADIYGTLEPAMEVGGDLYDFYKRDGKLFFCIGDVSGKGVPSAMLMSVIHSLFRMVSQKEESPSRILGALNEQLCIGNESNMFVTFFAACLDLYTGKLHFANAGHDKPFVLTESASLLPVKSNLPLGVFPGTVFEEQSLELLPGSALFLYTDGLTEAKNKGRDALGRKRVQEALERCLSSGKNSPEQLVQALADTAHAFVGDAPQSDDLTLLSIRFLPGELLRETITLANDIEEVALLSRFVKDFCESLNLDNRTASGLRLALEETVVNVINYAYAAGETGEVTVYAESNRQEIRFTVVDSGFPFDPTAVLSADTSLDARNRPIGGLGIHLTRKLMDSVSYCRKHDKNVLTLTKSIS